MMLLFIKMPDNKLYGKKSSDQAVGNKAIVEAPDFQVGVEGGVKSNAAIINEQIGEPIFIIFSAFF